MYEKVFAYLDAHAEDYAAQLCRWVEVPSVKGEATPGAPFGKDVRRMLDVAMADAKAFGYETRDFDGYACDITLPGESEEAIAVLGHLDVVPAGDNWATPPFTATRVGDQIFARGTSDDKGPALAALYPAGKTWRITARTRKCRKSASPRTLPSLSSTPKRA